MTTSIKAGIATKLAAAAITARVYHRELPVDPEYPATVYDVISDIPISYCHDANVIGFRRARLQIDVIAESVDAAEDAMEQYVALLGNFSGTLGLAPFTDVSILDAGANPDMDFEAEPTLRGLEGRSRNFFVLY